MKKKSLKLILTVNFVLTAMLPLFVLGIVSMSIMKSSMEKEIVNKNFMIAKSLSGEVQKFLEQPSDVFGYAEARLTGDSLINSADINLFLEGLINHFNYFTSIQILDNNGRITYMAPFEEHYIGNDLSKQPYFQITLKTKKPYWSSTFISYRTNKPAVALGKPFKGGVIVGYLDLDKLNAIIDKIKIGANGYAAIADQDGTTIAHPNRAFVSERLNVKNLNMIQQGLAGKEGTFNYRFMGIDKLGSVAIIPATGWLVIAIQPLKEALAPIKEITIFIWLGITISTFIALIVAGLNLRKILTPLFQLSDNSKRVASGEYQIQPHKESYKEIDELVASFSQMVKVLRSREDNLKESEEKYRDLFEYSRDAILLLDIGKGYLDCNPAALELFAIGSKEQLYELNPSVLSPEYQPDGSLSEEKAKQMIANAFEKGSYMFEWTHKGLDGREFQAIVLVARLQWGGRIVLQGSIRDISEYKRTQELMIQTEKMMSVGGLAAGMAHEINNPLAGMIQTANVMANRLGEDMDIPASRKAAEAAGTSMEAIKHYMDARGIQGMITAINESGLRVADIVDNMLSFARKSETAHSSHDVTDLLNKILELASTDYDLKKHYDFKMIEIEKEYEDNLPFVLCEGAQIQQVLLNILRNGAQAMQEVGTEKPRFIVRTRFEKERKMVSIEIEDNGPGMDEETRKRIFEPFFTTKPMGEGTGLGLSVSYFIITENHRGEMTVESLPGAGAKFIIHLPLEKRKHERI